MTTDRVHGRFVHVSLLLNHPTQTAKESRIRSAALTKPDEISSTEKLLDLIRSPGSEDGASGISGSAAKPSRHGGGLGFRLFKPGKQAVVGIDIGHTYVRMAKVIPGNNAPWRLTEYRTVQLKAEASLRDKAFLAKLRAALESFCGKDSGARLWATIPSSRVENRCIRIPKLPRKQVPNAVYWTFTKKINFDASRDLLDFEILGEVAEDGVTKYEIMAFSAPKAQVREMADAFESIGYPLTGISIVPFAIQNLFRRRVIDAAREDVCTLFIGRDWSRIAIYSRGNLLLSRGIKAGMRSMIEAIDQARGGGENSADAGGPDSTENTLSADEIFRHLISGAAVYQGQNTDKPFPSRKDIFQMILPALERLVRQVERTIEHYTLNFRKDGISKLFISGPVAASGMVTSFLSNQLEVPITVLDPFVKSRFFVVEPPLPPTTAERESYVPSIGMALSDNRWTPNFLFTHEEKARIEQTRKLNVAVLAGGILLCLVLTGVYLTQNLFLANYQARLAQLNRKLLTYNPPADKNLILTLFARSKNKRLMIKQISRRYYPLALIEEISRLTPGTIRLISLDAVMGNTVKGKAPVAGSLVLEGIILPGRRAYESILSGYLLRLKDSPLIRNPVIQSKSTQDLNGKHVLRFRVRFELVQK